MSPREGNLLLLLLGVAGAGAYFYFTQSGRALSKSVASTIQTGVERVADLTDSTLQTIIGFEDFSSKPYRDAKGWSIGYGHYMGLSPTIESISRADAYDLLRSDAQTARDAVTAKINLPMNQNEFDALVSLAYNIGAAGFTGSTVARLFNAGDKDGAANAFRMWNKSQGAVNQTLVARRERERALFLS